MTSKFLLRGGIVLVHDKHDHVIPMRSDLLVEGNKIIKIEKSIKVDASVSIIDCTNKIISPGFVDTHHHLWQTQLKGRHGNESLLDYIYSGSMMSYSFVPNDVFWGQLGGAVEAIDSGTTTVVDFSHVLYSPDHAYMNNEVPATSALSATISSGLRSVFCYCPTMVVKSFNPKLELDMNILPDWLWAQLVDLSEKQPFGSGRVQLGFAFDGYFAPKEVVLKLFGLVRSLGIKLITSHYVRGQILGTRSLVNLLDSYGILGPDLLIAHATQASHDDAVKLVEANAHISSTPDTELQMALGEPVCFRADLESISSLGVDCHTASSTGIFGQMHLALQNARGTRNQRLIEDGKFPDSIFPTVEEAYNLGTIKGARAIRQEADIGSLAVGKKADIVIFDATSPALICASQHDPVSAIVLHASSRDIDYVMIDGHVRKENGAILPVVIEREISPDEGGTVSWKDIAEELLRSRKEIQERIDQIDLSNTRSEVITAFQIDRTSLSG